MIGLIHRRKISQLLLSTKIHFWLRKSLRRWFLEAVLKLALLRSNLTIWQVCSYSFVWLCNLTQGSMLQILWRNLSWNVSAAEGMKSIITRRKSPNGSEKLKGKRFWSIHPIQAGPLRAGCPAQWACIQGGRFSRQPEAALSHLHSAKVFPDVQCHLYFSLWLLLLVLSMGTSGNSLTLSPFHFHFRSFSESCFLSCVSFDGLVHGVVL